MSTAEEKASLHVGVTAAADTTGVKGILYRAAASTSNTALTLPVTSTNPKNDTVPVAGRWINIFADSANLQYAFGETSAPTLVYDQAVTMGTGSAAAGATIPAGQIVGIIIPSKARYLSIISASASGKVEMYVSEGPG